jgi:N-acetylneuraminic acid mutarotase
MTSFTFTFVIPFPHMSGRREWKKLRQDHSGYIPSARSGAQACVNLKRIYFFGGYTRKGGDYFNDLFYFDIMESCWKFVDVEASPSQRTDHSFVEFDGCLYLYGGRDEIRIFSDLHKFSIKNQTWECVQNYIQEPKLRFGHTAVKWNECMYVFGGWDGVATLNDLYAYSFRDSAWIEVET